jgi:hypothetical protein
MAALNALYKSGDGFGSRNIMPAAGRDTCKLTAGLLHQEVTVPSTTRLMNSITARGSVSASATALLLCIPPLMKLSKMRTTPLGLLGLLQALLQFHVFPLVQTRSQSTAVPCRWGRHSRTTGLPQSPTYPRCQQQNKPQPPQPPPQAARLLVLHPRPTGPTPARKPLAMLLTPQLRMRWHGRLRSR